MRLMELTSPLTQGVTKHWASQYPVPTLAPPGFNLDRPPSALISDRYSAPFIPQGSFETSTSKENSPPVNFSISYCFLSLLSRYALGLWNFLSLP